MLSSNPSPSWERPPKISVSLRCLLAAFLAIFALLSIGYAGIKWLRVDASLVFFIVLACFLAALLAGIGLYRLLLKVSPWAAGCVLFVFALLLRLAFGLFAECMPVSDFANYLQMAVSLHSGDRAAIAAIVEHYQITEFAGLAVLNYLISCLFGATISGMQLANTIMTSLITVAVFHLGSQFDKRGGILAALLYALYPGSILSSQILTNQHAATLFALLSVFLLLRAARLSKWLPSLLCSTASAALLVVSHFFHPSSLPTQIAFVCFLGTHIFRFWRHRQKLLRYACLLLCFVASFQLLSIGFSAGLRAASLAPSKTETSVLLRSVVFGLNPDTQGTYSLEDYTHINAAAPEDRVALCISMILERIAQPISLLKTLAAKTFTMWVRTDNLFLFYGMSIEQGADRGTSRAETALTVANSLQPFDVLFMAVVFIGACVFLLFPGRKKHLPALDLVVWVLLGWLGVHLLSEIQPRYRYYAMPYLTALSGAGWVWLLGRINMLRAKKSPAALK